MGSSLTEIIQRIRAGLNIPPIELVYSSHPNWPHPRPGTSHPITGRACQIAVLDSSFNPPTLAHLALANHPRPRYTSLDPDTPPLDYDAKLLLLSIRNADKNIKSTDATYEQRVQMMVEMAHDIVTYDEHGNSIMPGNVAVAMIDEPTFVGKSHILQAFLRARLYHTDSEIANNESPASTLPLSSELVKYPAPRLTFLLGFDTLERFFSPRYYTNLDSESEDPIPRMHAALRTFFAPPPRGDDSRVVCASRSPSSYQLNSADTSETSSQQTLINQFHQFLIKDSLCPEYVQMIRIGSDIEKISSSALRQAVGQGQEEWCLTTDKVARFIQRQGLYKS